MTVMICLSTCPDSDTAGRIAEALVDARLAACVNIVPGVASVYRWEGAIVHEREWLLVIKTRAECLSALRERLPLLHPYELPELVAVEAADGLPAYLDWVRAETRPTP